ncbi:hypothetical protein [Methylocystis parvus]|uniref:Uncharacterized protein n=1 Tax=Methylocystis parvus TaxID=134 RepID=A0A6B8M687_9HYPH|nr:hypothetical protein [Methylocystis parvus]QGM97865.1 hypothetical protein F7D14_10555 [Methylocystis parvus]WBK01826.1 hypothetical protein MMG94_09025 [Methylocystis parvus OBBP]
MKALRLASALMALCSALLANPVSAAPTPVSGYYVVTINGFLRLPISQGGQVTCTGYLYVVPNTTGNPAISTLGAAILGNSATSNGSVAATVQENKQNFSCPIVVPYFFNSFDSATQSLYLVYSVKLNDPGFINAQQQIIPGTGVRSTRQSTIVTPAPSGTGTVTNLGPFVIYL